MQHIMFDSLYRTANSNLSAVTSDMGKHYSACCFTWSAIRPLYGLSELAGRMNRNSVMEVTLLRESFLM